MVAVRRAEKNALWEPLLMSIAAATVALSLFDGLFTLHWIEIGEAYEFNPLMAELIQMDARLFLVGKLSLLVGGVAMLYIHRDRRLSIVAMLSTFVLHIAVAIYHLIFLGDQLMA